MFEYYHAAICHQTRCLLDLALNNDKKIIFIYYLCGSFDHQQLEQQQQRKKNIESWPFAHHLRSKFYKTLDIKKRLTFIIVPKIMIRPFWFQWTPNQANSTKFIIKVCNFFSIGTRKSDFNDTSWLEKEVDRNSSEITRWIGCHCCAEDSEKFEFFHWSQA